jgi:hypothetical protein
LPQAFEKARIRHCQKNLAGKLRRKSLVQERDRKSMPVLLFGIGAFALFAGLVMVGFGIPINEFSFGNTLISAGTTAVVGGLIIIGLGIVAGQLRRVAEAITAQPVQFGQPMEAYENAGVRAAPPQGRVPFPPRSRLEPIKEPGAPPASATIAADDQLSQSFAPTLRNPDESPVSFEDEISLSPRHPVTPSTPIGTDHTGFARSPGGAPLSGSAPDTPDKNRDSTADWRMPPPPASPQQARPAHNPNFDAMWPADAKVPKSSGGSEPRSDSRFDAAPRDALTTSPKHGEPQKPRAVAILKSGVVDGMGYTLYVDGSIEAELPQGTLRFASITELRSHLEKNT